MRPQVQAAATLGLLGLVAFPLRAQDLVLTNARILDPASRTESRGALWIENGRIVGSGPNAPDGAKGQRIDLQGRWVIPGLVDMHVHSFGNMAPGGVFDAGGTESTSVRVLRAGVTGFLDLFADERSILPLRDRQRAGAIGGAEIFAAGPCFTATKGHCSEYGTPTRLVDSPEDARRQVEDLAPKRPDVIKLVYDHYSYGYRNMPSMDLATMRALVEAAKQHGFKTIVHVGSWQDVRDVVNAGATAVTHVARDGVVPDDVPALMLAHHTWHIPTLAVQTDLPELFDRPELVDSPIMARVASDSLRALYRGGLSGPRIDNGTRHAVEHARGVRGDYIESVRRLHAAGVPMLAGTDAGNFGTVQGYSLHRELIRLVEAGLSPWDALAAATTRAGEFLGRQFGVRPGDDGNIVVLDASPIDDIANTQRISMVVMRGKIVFGR